MEIPAFGAKNDIVRRGDEMNQKTAFALTNPLSLLLDKPAGQFTRSDILRIQILVLVRDGNNNHIVPQPPL